MLSRKELPQSDAKVRNFCYNTHIFKGFYLLLIEPIEVSQYVVTA